MTGVLLLMPGAGGRGTDSLAHHIMLRHHQLTLADPLGATGPALTGPALVAPGCPADWDQDGSLRTYATPLPAQAGAAPGQAGALQWWRAEPGREPRGLGPALPGVARLPDG